MDGMLQELLKILSHKVVVQIYSYPSFSIEAFLAAIVCVVHFLLITEVNELVSKSKHGTAVKLHLKEIKPIHKTKQCKQFHSQESLTYSQSPIENHRKDSPALEVMPRRFSNSEIFCRSHSCNRCQLQLPEEDNSKSVALQSFSTSTTFNWVVPKIEPTCGKSITPAHYDKIEHILSITPSEYIRRDKEKKIREAGLKTCIQSLTTLLERALNNESFIHEQYSKERLKKSLEHLKDQLENSYSSTFNPDLSENSPSLHNMITKSYNRKILNYVLTPALPANENAGEGSDSKTGNNLPTIETDFVKSDIFDQKSCPDLRLALEKPPSSQNVSYVLAN